MALHLTNTFFLLGALTLTAHWASGGARFSWRRQGSLAGVLAASMVGMVVLGSSGAVTALGDTLFPARSLADGLTQDLSAGAHLFVRLRILHPVIATAVAALVLLAATLARLQRPRARKLSWLVLALVLAQMAAGILNVWLLAPIFMQLVHLLLATRCGSRWCSSRRPLLPWKKKLLRRPTLRHILLGHVREPCQIAKGQRVERRARRDGPIRRAPRSRSSFAQSATHDLPWHQPVPNPV